MIHMKNQPFGYLGEDPDEAILKMMRDDLEGNDKVTLMMLLKIEGLLYGCFEFGINPLPTLRKIFPAYSWKYIDLTDKKPKGYRACLANIIMKSDFFWHTVDCGDGNHWVIAKKIGSNDTPRRTLGNNNPSEQPDNVLEMLRACPSHKSYWLVDDTTRVKLKNNRIML